MSEAPVIGTNASSGGGAPTGAAGGELAGTYPNPTVKDGVIDNANIVAGGLTAAALAAAAGITSGQLAGSIAPSKITGTAIVATDTVNALTAPAADFSMNTHKVTNVTNPTSAQDGSTKAYADSGASAYRIAPGVYSAPVHPLSWAGTTGVMPNANDLRWLRIVMDATGTLHDLYVQVAVTGGNSNVGVLDDGQANATHTVRTCLAVKGSTATPAAGQWFGFDPNLAVVKGDTLVFFVTADGTTAKFGNVAGNLGGGALPTTSFFPGSGAATTNQKLAGTIATANFTPAVNNTVTDANVVAAANAIGFTWRIS